VLSPVNSGAQPGSDSRNRAARRRPLLDEAAVALIRIADLFPRGSVRLARLMASVRPSLRRYPAKTRYGTIICDVSETACYGLAIRGEISHWRADEEAILHIPLNEQSVVLDIGANIGVMTRIFAERAGHVHAFEPAPRALALLRENAPPNCTIHPVAIGDHEGVARFAELEALDESHLAEDGLEVALRTVDSLGIRPDLIKIDVEGYEPQVLKGATETLRRGPMLMFEALTSEALEECRSIILAANPGYRFHDMGSGENFFASVDANDLLKA
jgi:FkbM family methyltransferase